MKKSILLFAATLFAAATFAQTPTVSASSVTFKYCETTDTAFSITVPAGMLPYFYNGEYVEEFGTSVHTLVNARGCDSIVALTLVDSKGAIPFAFTIDENGTKVYFSQGNLQYCAAPTSGETEHKVAYPENDTQKGIFRFAEHQYDFVGDKTIGNVYKDGSKCNNLKYAEDYTGWIDVFPWGASGYESRYPYLESSADISSYSNIDYDSYQKYYDWGMFNAISNGGNNPGEWFMLNFSQWDYLLNSRDDAHKKIANATVNGVRGTILLPDNWNLPQGVSFEPEESYTVNTYTEEQWKLMEANGAIFLLAYGGYMYYYSNHWICDENSYYWESSNQSGYGSYRDAMYAPIQSSMNGNSLSYYGSNLEAGNRASVRLVRKVQ